METKFNFNSQICTNKVQSERLLALGLKKETADMCWIPEVDFDAEGELYDTGNYYKRPIMGVRDFTLLEGIPAWSLHRLIEILDTNPFVFYTNCGYDTVIDHVEEYIRSGFIDTRYLEEWCLNEEE